MEDEYAPLQKEFGLPSFAKLDEEFDISTIESKGKPLQDVLTRMKDRVEHTVHLLQDLIHPSGDTVMELVESSFLTQEDKKKLVLIEKDLMVLYREFLVAKFARENKKDAQVINDVAEKFPPLRKAILPYIEKIKQGWEKEGESEEVLNYLG
ncbi:MAG: hypothetical protein QF486_04050 [Candidatus Woesearchaeota archaeon]|jgi:hypothetical protein|nr:hypothetical protein [Candidatus Woesearchaeota archaeon]MDP7181678.1 hypothetical protein [Candidatus Woesearchaeota archaeon]MDP7198767.1 hypothetical protein [Candidatus Woesearchaeota archaeon]MDP7467233.1 hypothetical protein [Candidatus Woesearchaeota archaeon]MDP7647432.1 hypothetical protein [Candidatus Woesearchaeota archaeon]|tara:strand:- start:389 stop:844 length:456 start_codon:yes stop_codon:yes gene_type:complete